jgi:hypothetical protein
VRRMRSLWVVGLDHLLEIVAAVGNKLDVIMLPEVEGACDIRQSRPAACRARGPPSGFKGLS